MYDPTNLPCPVCEHSSTNKNTCLQAEREESVYMGIHKGRCKECSFSTTIFSVKQPPDGRIYFLTFPEAKEYHAKQVTLAK